MRLTLYYMTIQHRILLILMRVVTISIGDSTFMKELVSNKVTKHNWRFIRRL